MLLHRFKVRRQRTRRNMQDHLSCYMGVGKFFFFYSFTVPLIYYMYMYTYIHIYVCVYVYDAPSPTWDDGGYICCSFQYSLSNPHKKTTTEASSQDSTCWSGVHSPPPSPHYFRGVTSSYLLRTVHITVRQEMQKCVSRPIGISLIEWLPTSCQRRGSESSLSVLRSKSTYMSGVKSCA